ncbi:hypothetical protein CVT25_011136 [Psilocybe cyanescens]|uniref:AAA+ ATPase domain-containing protein n=1 Tax=Psilocybe cyanescens TaxID=93625 RepID=A0A409WGU3_PSICY|nr:hypothetical protein CVT25_011136 [Psilocybe cyanescens]
MARSKEHTNEEDEFVNIWTTEEGQAPAADSHKDKKDFYEQWVAKCKPTICRSLIPLSLGMFGSLPLTRVSHSSISADALRALYPGHSLILTQGYSMNILGFPAANVKPIEKTQLVTNLVYVPIARSLGTVPGILVDQIEFGAFKVTWKQYEYIIYSLQFPQGFGVVRQYFVLHKGPEEISRLFLLAAGAWSDSLHDEIWVFNQGYWAKDHGLWVQIQKADWKDVILKEEFKKALQKDVYGFFASEAIYKELAIPWKRGLIMHGPPGNGKTISLKTIMKTCGEKGFAPLYVKSFRSWKGDEGAMADVFDKARQLAPCVIILEDLDSLINDGNRSFFLNQLDGLEGNDGLLVIGTTNHFDRLDPGLSTRPSRFDRKFKFDDPDEEERKLYAQYWQTKLQSNKEVDFPDQLVDKVAHLTDRFSFAYLKEVFVSSLVTFVGIEGEKPTFESLLVKQIEVLRKQLDKPNFTSRPTARGYSGIPLGRNGAPPSNPPVRRPRATSVDREVDGLISAMWNSTLRFDSNSQVTSNDQASERRASMLATDTPGGRHNINLLNSVPDPISELSASQHHRVVARRARMQGPDEDMDIDGLMNWPGTLDFNPTPEARGSSYTPFLDAKTSATGLGNPWNPFSRNFGQRQGPTSEHDNGATPRNFGTGDYGLV